MRRSEWNKQYTTVLHVDPKTGKEKQVLRYIGSWYAMEPGQRKACAIQCGLGWLLGTAAFLAAGLVPNWVSLCRYVTPWYVLCMVPLIYLLLGLITLLRLKPTEFTEIARSDSLGYIRASSWGMVILGGLWSITSAMFLVQNQTTITLVNELIFLGAGVVTAGIGGWLLLMLKGLRLTTWTNEKEAADTAASAEENQ